MMKTKMDPETSATFNQTTRLLAREDFINTASVKVSDLAVHCMFSLSHRQEACGLIRTQPPDMSSCNTVLCTQFISFVYGLLNDTFNDSDHAASNDSRITD